jgi:hypothetical protein
MRTATIKITFLVLIGTTANIGISFSAPSRIECLERLGNTTTKAELDNCVKATPPANHKPSQLSTIDSASEETICLELGFKKKTEAYGRCVLELLERRSISSNQAKQSSPSSPDDATCRQYGFKPGSNEYASCRLQIDQARQDAQRQQAQFEQQQRQYEAQLEAQRDARSRAAGLALLNLGLGTMAGGGFPGTAPVAPVPPQNFNRTYTLPGGRIMNCTTTGTMTNCF